jgi:ribonuclease BN (tRNA processing enzyme)
MNDCYEVYAVKYAQKLDRFRRDNFIVADAHDTPMPMDYFVWAIVNSERTIVVDTGFGHADAERRGRQMLRLPREGLALVGIDAAQVREVVVTHLHYDHAGTLEDFPNARFHLNDREMAHATGRMRHVVPGHDPQVLQHYRAGEASLEGIVARLHEPPIAGTSAQRF